MNRQQYLQNLRLVTRPNFFKGAGSVFNLSGIYYMFNYTKSEEEADYRALRSDWVAVGRDLMKVMDEELCINKDER